MRSREFDSLPHIPFILRNNDQAIEVVGLVDSGTTVDVFFYNIGNTTLPLEYSTFII
ncbi:hypothetical protein H6F78_05085 [Coleofasciculus sp. FACHB-64]|uniref:hypothetical protein n=1 Tax=Cyanophyceae TaxID=3028117 RepID=UPI00168921CE|nr:hypothetical protein [Coleofasciculus sp. FACHB-64]MBD2045010.1 hypothetical protein [Coleofasciculus sp. FACHB-64]